MYKTGHSLIKAKMKQIEAEGGQAPLGGEMSGHIFSRSAGMALMMVLMQVVAC